ncbi:hypothetical protein ASD24_29535 [Paenibacillus sp. Root52]|uniref:hypothetical protein n=1 Tax=Paenibacillus sp. Root52 TaxID=1736552 RepID=UPI0006F67F0A|nr:hypothetical protein [Paenibacillus sp. Root52]KQY83752.1 hypothetical protein ASD24_29535 [Paenibacillus sp. Root52]
MNNNSKVKLSELPEITQLSYEGATCTYTIQQVRTLISEDAEWAAYDWHVCTPVTWKPSAKKMIENYIEQEHQNMYEEWDVQAAACVTTENITEIQVIIDKMFVQFQHWSSDGPEVILDCIDKN